MRTGEEFLEALNDGRRVFIQGEQIANVATHPKTKGYSQQLAAFYDLHHRPELEEVMTFVDDQGERHSKTWLLPRSEEDLAGFRRYQDYVARMFGAAQFGRLPAVNNLSLFAFMENPEPWEENSIGTDGIPLADNIRRFCSAAVEDDLHVSIVFQDVQADRSRPDVYRESPDLRVIDRNDEGIVINGTKGVSTAAIWSDWLLVGTIYKPGMEEDQIMYLAVPANAPGVTQVGREPTQKPEGDPDHPLASLGDELESFVRFDNVFVPWEDVFHLGNPDHAKLYPQRAFDWIHYQDLTRQCVKAELLVGLALLICDAIGTIRIPAIQMRLTDLVRFREALLAHLNAADATGFLTRTGVYRPNNRFYDFGRAMWLDDAPRMIYELLDLVGRSTVLMPIAGDWEHPDLRPWLEGVMRGPIAQDERLKIVRVIRDLYLSEWGGRNAMFDNFNGMPLTATRLLTMNRTEYSPNGPLTAYARQICGLPLSEGQKTIEEEVTPEYARAIDAKTS